MPKVTVSIDIPQSTIDRVTRWVATNLTATKNKDASVNDALSRYANQWFGPAGDFGSDQVDQFMADYLKLPAGAKLARQVLQPK